MKKPLPHNHPFIGIEAEGPWRGMETLFVPSSCSLRPRPLQRRVMTELTRRSIRRVYFGAGWARGIGKGQRAFIVRLLRKGYIVFLEQSLWAGREDVPKGVKIILAIDRPARTMDHQVEAVKLLSGGVIRWYEGPPYITSLSDPLYDGDKEIV